MERAGKLYDATWQCVAILSPFSWCKRSQTRFVSAILATNSWALNAKGRWVQSRRIGQCSVIQFMDPLWILYGFSSRIKVFAVHLCFDFYRNIKEYQNVSRTGIFHQKIPDTSKSGKPQEHPEATSRIWKNPKLERESERILSLPIAAAEMKTRKTTPESITFQKCRHRRVVSNGPYHVTFQ